MPKGIDFIWAIDCMLAADRRAATKERDEALRSLVRDNFLIYGDEATIGSATQALLRLRTFRDEDLDQAISTMKALFPGMADLPNVLAQQLVERTIEEVKAASRSTFGTRTKYSTVQSVVATCEPGYAESNLRHILEADVAALNERGDAVRAYEIQSDKDFTAWVPLVWSNFFEFEEAEERARKHPAIQRGSTNIRMYNRNWNEWIATEGRFDQLLRVIASGEAENYGRHRERMNAHRRQRSELRQPGFDQATFVTKVNSFRPEKSESASLRITLTVGTGESAQAAKKLWNVLPRESLAVKEWAEAILGIWGDSAMVAGCSVKAEISSTAGESEVSFVARDSDEIKTKTMLFVQAYSS